MIAETRITLKEIDQFTIRILWYDETVAGATGSVNEWFLQRDARFVAGHLRAIAQDEFDDVSSTRAGIKC